MNKFLLGENLSKWENWILIFSKREQISKIYKIIPTRNPKLGKETVSSTII